MTIAAVNSYAPPSATQLDAAQRAGIRMWNGYLSSRQDPGIDTRWSAPAFVAIRAKLGPVWLNGVAYNGIAYCSGQAQPLVCKAIGKAWNVLIALDVEGGIRPLGSWTQAWVDEAQSGVYGNAPVMTVRAAFHVIAAWVADAPASSWPGNVHRPPGPCGWQWAGNVPLLGEVVDRNSFDSSFATPPSPTPAPEEPPEVQTPIVIPATGGAEPTLVPGVTGSNTLELAAYQPCNVEIFLWTPQGGAVASRVITLSGNQPGKLGPVEVYGTLYELFAAPPATEGGSGPVRPGVPYLLGLFPALSTVTKAPVQYSAAIL